MSKRSFLARLEALEAKKERRDVPLLYILKDDDPMPVPPFPLTPLIIRGPNWGKP